MPKRAKATKRANATNKGRPMTTAERSRRYQKNLLLKASSDNPVTRRRANKLLRRQTLRKKAKRPVANIAFERRCSTETVPTITWITKTRNFSTSRLKSNLRHAMAAPLVVNGGLVPVTPSLEDRDIWFKDDHNVWRLWLHRRTSKIPNAGLGLFAARSFLSGAVLTKYIGKTTRNKARGLQWQRAKGTRGYVFQFDSGCTTWVVPSSHCFYAHYMNHATEPNCEVDAHTGVITAKFDIPKNTELTLNYGPAYMWRVE
jgi:hypothetical protein